MQWLNHIIKANHNSFQTGLTAPDQQLSIGGDLVLVWTLQNLFTWATVSGVPLFGIFGISIFDISTIILYFDVWMFLPTHWVMEHMRGAKTKIQFQSVSDSKRWQITFQITSEVRQMVRSDSSSDLASPFKALHLYYFSNAHITWGVSLIIKKGPIRSPFHIGNEQSQNSFRKPPDQFVWLLPASVGRDSIVYLIFSVWVA